MYPRTAVVLMSPRARTLAPFYLGEVGAGAVRDADEPDAGGWARVELPVESHSAAIGDLLRFGPHVQVLEPPELRAQITESLLAMSAHYGP